MLVTTEIKDTRLYVFYEGNLVACVDAFLFRRDSFFFSSFSSRQDFLEQFLEHEYKVAFRFSLKKVSQRAMHSHQLLQVLKNKGFSTQAQKRVIEEFHKKKWLNDAEFLTAFNHKKIKQGKSRLEALASLKNRGIGEPVGGYSDTEALESLIRKKYPQLLVQDLSREEKEKIIARLFRKGFRISDIRDVILRLALED